MIPLYKQSARRWFFKIIHPVVNCHYFPPGHLPNHDLSIDRKSNALPICHRMHRLYSDKRTRYLCYRHSWWQHPPANLAKFGTFLQKYHHVLKHSNNCRSVTIRVITAKCASKNMNMALAKSRYSLFTLAGNTTSSWFPILISIETACNDELNTKLLISNNDVSRQIIADLNNRPLFDIFLFFRRRKKEVVKFWPLRLRS